MVDPELGRPFIVGAGYPCIINRRAVAPDYEVVELSLDISTVSQFELFWCVAATRDYWIPRTHSENARVILEGKT